MALAAMFDWIKSVPGVPDVTIRLVSNGGIRYEVHSGVDWGSGVKLHSRVLNSYSGYIRALSKGPPFVSLEVQAPVCCYEDCFSRMYSLHLKNFDFGLKDFGDVKYSLELLKVASQIQFGDLIDSILLSLSTRYWSKEDEERIREYSSSKYFPRSRAEDLVGRLGLNESEEDRNKQLCDMLQHLVFAALDPKMHDEFTGNYMEMVESAGCRSYRYILKSVVRDNVGANATPSNLGRTVITMLTREAKSMLDGLNRDCVNHDQHLIPSGSAKSCKPRILAMCYVLKVMLAFKVAGLELIKSFVHSNVISSRCYVQIYCRGDWEYFLKKLTGLVLLICQEIVDGHLPFRSPERKALLANWHPLFKLYIKKGKDDTHSGKLKQITAKLFSTLSFQDQTEVLKPTSLSRDQYARTLFHSNPYW